uniref:Uncharacterized protein n=1 Tax=Plectus sambesii TaxID=2011161 RepID=A0A914ULK1_9BILA
MNFKQSSMEELSAVIFPALRPFPVELRALAQNHSFICSLSIEQENKNVEKNGNGSRIELSIIEGQPMIDCKTQSDVSTSSNSCSHDDSNCAAMN